MSKEAMKLALDALEIEDMACRYEKEPTPEHIAKAITALREALASQGEALASEAIEQPAQQEPVAWRAPNWGHGADEWIYRDFDDPVLIAIGKPSPNNEALYTSPPAQRTWVGLTDEEEVKLWESTDSDWELMKRVEAKLKEKNT